MTLVLPALISIRIFLTNSRINNAAWIQVRSATPLNIKTVRCDNHEVCSRQEVKNMRYTHLTENERYMISALRKQGISTAKIAKQLGRHKATIYREI
ncbi:helix-turn-helix domain-containing protein, partial [Vibrio parahaemolyticus]|uniref:helix-turn-helix domain-containing protein n=1 Tax=Vibrio parahaemolyticus TaxID=670 RepID=UPI0021552B41